MLATLEVDLLRPEVLTAALQEATVRLDRPAGDVEADRERLREIITRLQAELTRLTEALVSGGNLPSIVAAITEREAQRSRAQQEFAALDQVEQAHGFDLRRAEQDLRAKLADWRGLLSRNVAQARQALRSLVPERLTFTPKNEGGERFYVFEGMAVLYRFLAGIALPKALVAPRGFEPVVQSRPRFRQRSSHVAACLVPNMSEHGLLRHAPAPGVARYGDRQEAHDVVEERWPWAPGPGRRADATDGHDRRPRRHPADPRPSRAPGCEGRPAGPVLRCCGASRAAGREPGRPRRSVLSAPVDGARAAPRGSGLTCPARSDRIDARCHGSSAQWYGKSRPGNPGRMIVLDKWAAPRLNGITFGPPDSVRRWSIATPRRLTHE